MGIKFKELDLREEKDKKIMDRILSFDTTKDCFGDYDFYSVANEYMNLAIYDQRKLIGYLGFAHMDSVYYADKGRYTITICLRKEYQSKGLGDTILKKCIKTLFNDYDAETISVEVLESNSRCNKLIVKNNFKKERRDSFLKNGEYVNSIIYKYTKREYEEDKYDIKVYRKIN